MSAPSQEQFKHLDSVAEAISAALRKLGISFLFIGGYAVSLIGRRRVTKVSVIHM
jgi:hypothetical protein